MRLKRVVIIAGMGLVVWGARAGLGSEGIAEFRSASSRQNTQLTEPCPANQFPPIQIAFASVISELTPGTTTGIKCQVDVGKSGQPVRGVPIMLGGDLLTADGDPIGSLPTKSKSTNRAGQKTFNFPYTVPPAGDDVLVIMEGELAGTSEIDELDTTCGIVQRTPCSNSQTNACHLGRRFKVEVDVRTSSGTTPGMVLQASKNDSFFYFFSPGSSDLLVQLLNRCSSNDHFWVFASSSTSVPFDLTVTDTFNGESRAYTNPGVLDPILDTAAFATCP